MKIAPPAEISELEAKIKELQEAIVKFEEEGKKAIEGVTEITDE